MMLGTKGGFSYRISSGIFSGLGCDHYSTAGLRSLHITGKPMHRALVDIEDSDRVARGQLRLQVFGHLVTLMKETISK